MVRGTVLSLLTIRTLGFDLDDLLTEANVLAQEAVDVLIGGPERREHLTG